MRDRPRRSSRSRSISAPTAIEIVRAGLQAIPKPQVEAGQSLGLSGFQVFRYVILLPSLKLMFPALASQFILLMLATSVVSQISVSELFHAASIIQSRTFRDFEVYTVIGVLYLGLALDAARGSSPAFYRYAFACDDPAIRSRRPPLPGRGGALDGGADPRGLRRRRR